MANDYDLIFKENLEASFLPLFTEITQTDLKNTEELNLELQVTHERKADFLRKVLADKPYILHLEIQSKNDSRMLNRMVVYHAILREKYKYALPVKQYVLYIGKEKMNMKHRDDDFPNSFQYHLIDIREFPFQSFLQSDIPEMVVLAILADFQNQNPQILLQDILTRLVQLLPEDGRLYKYARQLKVLSKLRNLITQTQKILNTMPVIIDYTYTDDFLYVKGAQENLEANITKLLKNGKLSPQEIAEILEVPLEKVKEVQAKNLA